MYDNSKLQNLELLRDMSEQEQEILAAGQSSNLENKGNLFLQKTNLETQAENILNLKNGDISLQKTKYTLSQITLGASIKFGLPDFKLVENSASSFIGKLLNGLVS
ncbi:hypothetical protein WKK05_13765 [Nostoc sp. UHCC 0302]|uniref:hypothetical protein n=1 Tax=Nostoc sp. UHCC 0302 TaxID=3134896 RepID=UPI00311CC4D1